MSKDAICIINPKKTPAFGGKLTENIGMSTIIYCVFTIDHSYWSDAERNMLSTKLLTINTFDVIVSDSIAAANLAVKPLIEYCRGKFLEITVFGDTVRPKCEKKN
jgi:hypothetical protein